MIFLRVASRVVGIMSALFITGTSNKKVSIVVLNNNNNNSNNNKGQFKLN